jgi:hypothetical protein
VGVQDLGDAVGVGEDAGDVGGRGEAADDQRPVPVPAQLPLQVVQVHAAVGVGGYGHDVGSGLAPGQLVGVVLVGPDQDDRALVGAAPGGGPGLPVVRAGQSQDRHQLVDRGGGAGAAEEHQVVLGAADGLVDQPAGVLAQPGGLQAGGRALGVGVGVAGQHGVADEVLDEVQGAAGGGVVGVGDAARAVGAVPHLALADHAGAHPLQQCRGRCGAGRTGERPVADDMRGHSRHLPVQPAGERPGRLGAAPGIGDFAR